MSKPRLFSTAYLCGAGLETLAARFHVTAEPWLAPVPVKLLTEDEIVARVHDLDASVLVVEVEKVDAVLLARCPGLAVVVATRGDPTNLDVAACSRAGVLALATPGRNAVAVAELALGLLIACARGIVQADRDVRSDRWSVDGMIAQQRFRGPQLAGSTLGLVGYGAVGHALAHRAVALGMDVAVYDPYLDPDAVQEGVAVVTPLDGLLERSRFLSVHAALTDETRGMIGTAELARLPEGAILVNTAREPIVDRAALVAALESGRVAAAGLDHFDMEYLPPSDPLARLPNTVLTPHIGGACVGADEHHTAQVAHDLDELAAGNTPSGALNPECSAAAALRMWP